MPTRGKLVWGWFPTSIGFAVGKAGVRLMFVPTNGSPVSGWLPEGVGFALSRAVGG